MIHLFTWQMFTVPSLCPDPILSAATWSPLFLRADSLSVSDGDALLVEDKAGKGEGIWRFQ